MQIANPIQRDAVGRPVWLEDETEIQMVADVSLYDGELKSQEHVHGKVTLTTHRIIWIGARLAISFDLSAVASTECESGFLLRSPKLRVVWAQGGFIKMSFKDGGRDGFVEQLQQTLRRRAWAQASASQSKEPAAFTTSGAGIAGLIRRQQLEQRQHGQLATEAFSDLSALMEQAKPVVALVERFAKAQANASAAEAGGGGGSGSSAEDTEQLNALLMTIGIANPVTKQSAGSLYHEELSRQLAGFLQAPLAAAHGMLALPDVYCLFNRARGTALISPDDLLTAVKLADTLGLPMRLKQLGNGLLVVESNAYNASAISQKLDALLGERTCATALDVATEWQISLSIAQELLTSAEEEGKLCRDTTTAHILFYPNLFATFAT